MRNTIEISTKDQREDFARFVGSGNHKKSKFDVDKGIDLQAAFRYGYSDTARTLRGICSALKKKSTVFRDKDVIPMLVDELDDFLNTVPPKESFDEWHKRMCDRLWETYSDEGYKAFTVGKAQKWLNMAIKYACLYCYEHQDRLAKHVGEFHVPIDRYVAAPIVRELGVALPKYDGFRSEKDYAWSKIQDYDAYLRCQKEIREKCKQNNESPLHWEFKEWVASQKKKSK